MKAYLKRSKNDANDAAAICEAVTRPSMRFVPTKSEQQQSGLMLHRSRQLLVRQRTMLSNAIRGHLAEFGIISAKGRNGTVELLEVIANQEDDRIPAVARFSLEVLARQYAATAAEIGVIEKHIHAWHRSCEESRRLEQIPGVGPIVATALVAEVGDWKAFGSGRGLAAWIGLVPKQRSTGGKDKLGSITKQGNRYLRWLLVTGAMAVIRYAQKYGTLKRPWLGRFTHDLGALRIVVAHYLLVVEKIEVLPCQRTRPHLRACMPRLCSFSGLARHRRRGMDSTPPPLARRNLG